MWFSFLSAKATDTRKKKKVFHCTDLGAFLCFPKISTLNSFGEQAGKRETLHYRWSKNSSEKSVYTLFTVQNEIRKIITGFVSNSRLSCLVCGKCWVKCSFKAVIGVSVEGTVHIVSVIAYTFGALSYCDLVSSECSK